MTVKKRAQLTDQLKRHKGLLKSIIEGYVGRRGGWTKGKTKPKVHAPKYERHGRQDHNFCGKMNVSST